MSSPTDILQHKAALPTIIISILFSAGIGGYNFLSPTESKETFELIDNRLFEHASAEIPHPIITIELNSFKEYFNKHIENDKIEFNEYRRQYELHREEDKYDRQQWLKQYELDKKEQNEIILQILLELRTLNIVICSHNGYNCD